MKMLNCLLAAPVLAGLAIYLSACNDERPVAKIIVVDQKMPLIEWPDSIYVNSLDSILALEPVKKRDPKEDVNLTFSSKNAPIFKLPSSVTGKKDGPKQHEKAASAKKPSTDKPAGESGKSAENFAAKFMNAMSALQSDPNNASLYRMVEVREGEDLSKLLRRTYGAGSQTLPGFFVSSALKSVNAGKDVDNLSAGDKIKVPRI